MEAKKKLVVNDDSIMAVVTLRNTLKANKREEIFIQPFSRVYIEGHYQVDPITFNRHKRVKVL